MNLNRNLPWNSVVSGLILGLTLASFVPRAKANVYASNVLINGGITNIAATPGDTITISYRLNESASSGTTIQILSGASVVHSLFFPPGSQGTLRGFNEVTWDGKGPGGQDLPNTTYSLSVVPASSGYTNWTQITSDTSDLNTYVAEGRGIAVDRNPTSPYFGRIFVANAFPGLTTTTPGDLVGILKFNADTSDAEEGVSSAGQDGHVWAGGHVSPWKIEVSDDDYVYVDDLVNGGELLRWDPTISSNSLLYVLRQDNQPQGAALSGPALVGTGGNLQIWMGNTNAAQIFKWSVNSNSVCNSNDLGALVVSGTSSNLYDVALDNKGNVYTCDYTTVSGDPAPRVFRYAAGGGGPSTTPAWAVGGGDDSYAGASGLALDPTGTYLAVAFEGPAGGFSTFGNTRILWATNGAVAANLDLGVAMQGDDHHDDTDCAWDAAGNVYYIDIYFSVWRAFSPPGANQFSTVALANIALSGGTPPPPSTSIQITRITVSGGNVNIDFSAGTNDTASGFSILGAANVTGPFSTLNTAVITQTGLGLFHATFALGPGTQYFRISRQGTTPPPPGGVAFTKIAASGNNIVLTFSGSTTDPASAFTLLNSPVANGTYTSVANPNITVVSPGIFQASVPNNGSVQFYRIKR